METVFQTLLLRNRRGILQPNRELRLLVFMRSGSGYKLILDKGAVQTFAISSRRTNGFNDLVLGQHGSAYERDLFVYHLPMGDIAWVHATPRAGTVGWR